MQDRYTEMIPGISLPEIIFASEMIIFAAAMLIHYMRSEKPVKTALAGMLTGTASLVILHYFGGGILPDLPLNGFTAFIALTLGVPGVAAMCIILLF